MMFPKQKKNPKHLEVQQENLNIAKPIHEAKAV